MSLNFSFVSGLIIVLVAFAMLVGLGATDSSKCSASKEVCTYTIR